MQKGFAVDFEETEYTLTNKISLTKPGTMSKKICMVLVFLLTMAGMLSAQTRTVKGNVVFSEDGQPAIGAYV